MTLPFVLAIAVTLLGGAAHAQVFKCADAAGKVTYSQAPCPGAGRCWMAGAPVRPLQRS